MGSCLLHLLPWTKREVSAMGEMDIVESDNGARGTRRELWSVSEHTVELAEDMGHRDKVRCTEFPGLS